MVLLDEIYDEINQINYLIDNNDEIYYNNASSINEILQIKIAIEIGQLKELDLDDQQEKIEEYMSNSDYYEKIRNYDELLEYFSDEFEVFDSKKQLYLCDECKQSFDVLYAANNEISCIHELCSNVSFSDCYSDLPHIYEFFESEIEFDGLNAESFIEQYDYRERENRYYFICPSCLEKSFYNASCDRTKTLLDNSDHDALILCEDCFTKVLTEFNIQNIADYEAYILNEYYDKCRDLRNKKRFHHRYYKQLADRTHEYSKYSDQINYYLNYRNSANSRFNTIEAEKIQMFMSIFE